MMKFILLAVVVIVSQSGFGANAHAIAKRNAVTDPKLKWPGGKVPYTLDPKYNADQKALIMKAMKIYEDKTQKCIQFVERTNEKDYLSIVKGKGCGSGTGRKGGMQIFNLGEKCFYVGVILHHIGHAIGLHHQQNRSDRDDYIIIHFENVKPGYEHEFDKMTPAEATNLTPFDLNSIMIDGSYVFSKDGTSKTMEAKNGQNLPSTQEKTTISDLDVETIKKLYQCK